tara:strand:+ start:645 stop:2825 length:2181 start_codon:yes stop_codon:yes gene_type:complete
MSSKTPIRTVFNDSNVATGLAEFQTGEFIPLSHGGIGAALSIGSAGQVLKVNTGGTALEFGAVEAIVNIDGATDLESATLVAGDKILLSDGGSEGRVLLSQLDTLFSGTTKTLTNKTLTTPIISSISNTGTITLPTSTDTLVGRATTDTLTNKTVSGASNTLSNIGNSSLSNSAVTVGTTSISLGASATTIAGVSDLTAGSINIAGNVIKSNDSTIVEIGGGDGLSVAGNLTVAGNMTVSGSTTTVSSTNTTLADQFIELGTGRTGSASGDAGIVIERGSDANAIIGFDESADEFIVGTGTFTGSSSGNLTFTYGTLSSAGNKIYKAGTAHAVSLVASSSLAGNVTLTLPVNDGDSNQLLATDGSGNLSFISATAASGAGLSDLSDDSTPSLGGNLDMNGNDIITLSNGNIDLLPHGTGKVIIDGNGTSGGVLIHDGNVDIRSGTGAVSKIKFYCEVSNAHAQTLQAQPHSAGSSAVLTLPIATGTLIGTGDSGTVSNTMLAGSIANAKLSNSTITIQDDSSTQDAVALGETLIFEGGSGVTTTVTDNKVSIATDGSIVTETSTDTLTNKTLTSAVLNGTISGTSIKDEDNMASDSSDHLATQQSIKAYVDAQITAEDLDFQADSGGALSIDLDSETMTFTGGTGIDTSGSGNTVTFAIDSTVATLAGTQTFTNKTLTSPKINEDVAVTATATELNFVDGVTSAIQTQLDNKAAKSFAIAQAVALG